MKLFELIKKKLFKKQPAKTGDHLVDFYNRIDEDSRLLSKHGRIEFLTTTKYIEKYLKDGMKIMEIGALRADTRITLLKKALKLMPLNSLSITSRFSN